MFLNAVVLVLQEILEAVLLISVMLVLGRSINRNWPELLPIDTRWVFAALAVGIAGALLYGWTMPVVSQWFDYVGLEVVNALLQAGIIAFLFVLCYLPGFPGRVWRPALVSQWSMTLVVVLGIVREGAEIILYLQGIMGQPENISPVLLGALMAAGIGISSGYLLYQGLSMLAAPRAFRVAMLLLALFAGNMAAQAVLLLTQADWLPYTMQLWDSSSLLPEYSIFGQLLYALVGYEANPSLLQAGAYFAALVLVLVSPLFRRAWSTRSVNGQ
jgi:high-affinity iron transporter